MYMVQSIATIHSSVGMCVAYSNNKQVFKCITLTSIVGKLFHKVLAIPLQRFLYLNNLIDPSAQKGFLTGINGTFEHIFSVSAILDNALFHHLQQ